MNFRQFQRQFLMNFSISAAVVNNFSSVSDAVSHEFSPALETTFSEFSRI